jgi:hypothetical protein
VYVTDGGHYENLGLVEVLRRRADEIVCFDAAGDTTDTFGTLADAMRLARAELGVEIDIDPSAMRARKEDEQSDPDLIKGQSTLGVEVATIYYPPAIVDGKEEPAKTGWLVFAKLCVPDRAPFDVRDLARTLPNFPTHPTLDQLYTDQKFEAYRALGQYLGLQASVAIRSLRSRGSDDTVEQAVKKAREAITKVGG